MALLQGHLLQGDGYTLSPEAGTVLCEQMETVQNAEPAPICPRGQRNGLRPRVANALGRPQVPE